MPHYKKTKATLLQMTLEKLKKGSARSKENRQKNTPEPNATKKESG